jgi:hypothetical protein
MLWALGGQAFWQRFAETSWTAWFLGSGSGAVKAGWGAVTQQCRDCIASPANAASLVCLTNTTASLSASHLLLWAIPCLRVVGNKDCLGKNPTSCTSILS